MRLRVLESFEYPNARERPSAFVLTVSAFALCASMCV